MFLAVHPLVLVRQARAGPAGSRLSAVRHAERHLGGRDLDLVAFFFRHPDKAFGKIVWRDRIGLRVSKLFRHAAVP